MSEYEREFSVEEDGDSVVLSIKFIVLSRKYQVLRTKIQDARAKNQELIGVVEAILLFFPRGALIERSRDGAERRFKMQEP